MRQTPVYYSIARVRAPTTPVRLPTVCSHPRALVTVHTQHANRESSRVVSRPCAPTRHQAARARSEPPPRPPPPSGPPERSSKRRRRTHDSRPLWKASLTRLRAALTARFLARSAHTRIQRVNRVQASCRSECARRSALTFVPFVDACWRALLGLAVLEPKAAAMQPLVATRALGCAARRVVKVRPSSRTPQLRSTRAHKLLEAAPAQPTHAWSWGQRARRDRDPCSRVATSWLRSA